MKDNFKKLKDYYKSLNRLNDIDDINIPSDNIMKISELYKEKEWQYKNDKNT